MAEATPRQLQLRRYRAREAQRLALANPDWQLANGLHSQSQTDTLLMIQQSGTDGALPAVDPAGTRRLRLRRRRVIAGDLSFDRENGSEEQERSMSGSGEIQDEREAMAVDSPVLLDAGLSAVQTESRSDVDVLVADDIASSASASSSSFSSEGQEQLSSVEQPRKASPLHTSRHATRRRGGRTEEDEAADLLATNKNMDGAYWTTVERPAPTRNPEAAAAVLARERALRPFKRRRQSDVDTAARSPLSSILSDDDEYAQLQIQHMSPRSSDTSLPEVRLSATDIWSDEAPEDARHTRGSQDASFVSFSDDDALDRRSVQPDSFQSLSDGEAAIFAYSPDRALDYDSEASIRRAGASGRVVELHSEDLLPSDEEILETAGIKSFHVKHPGERAARRKRRLLLQDGEKNVQVHAEEPETAQDIALRELKMRRQQLLERERNVQTIDVRDIILSDSSTSDGCEENEQDSTSMMQCAPAGSTEEQVSDLELHIVERVQNWTPHKRSAWLERQREPLRACFYHSVASVVSEDIMNTTDIDRFNSMPSLDELLPTVENWCANEKNILPLENRETWGAFALEHARRTKNVRVSGASCRRALVSGLAARKWAHPAYEVTSIAGTREIHYVPSRDTGQQDVVAQARAGNEYSTRLLQGLPLVRNDVRGRKIDAQLRSRPIQRRDWRKGYRKAGQKTYSKSKRAALKHDRLEQMVFAGEQEYEAQAQKVRARLERVNQASQPAVKSIECIDILPARRYAGSGSLFHAKIWDQMASAVVNSGALEQPDIETDSLIDLSNRPLSLDAAAAKVLHSRCCDVLFGEIVVGDDAVRLPQLLVDAPRNPHMMDVVRCFRAVVSLLWREDVSRESSLMAELIMRARSTVFADQSTLQLLELPKAAQQLDKWWCVLLATLLTHPEPLQSPSTSPSSTTTTSLEIEGARDAITFLTSCSINIFTQYLDYRLKFSSQPLNRDDMIYDRKLVVSLAAYLDEIWFRIMVALHRLKRPPDRFHKAPAAKGLHAELVRFFRLCVHNFVPHVFGLCHARSSDDVHLNSHRAGYAASANIEFSVVCGSDPFLCAATPVYGFCDDDAFVRWWFETVPEWLTQGSRAKADARLERTIDKMLVCLDLNLPASGRPDNSWRSSFHFSMGMFSQFGFGPASMNSPVLHSLQNPPPNTAVAYTVACARGCAMLLMGRGLPVDVKNFFDPSTIVERAGFGASGAASTIPLPWEAVGLCFELSCALLSNRDLSVDIASPLRIIWAGLGHLLEVCQAPTARRECFQATLTALECLDEALTARYGRSPTRDAAATFHPLVDVSNCADTSSAVGTTWTLDRLLELPLQPKVKWTLSHRFTILERGCMLLEKVARCAIKCDPHDKLCKIMQGKYLITLNRILSNSSVDSFLIKFLDSHYILARNSLGLVRFLVMRTSPVRVFSQIFWKDTTTDPSRRCRELGDAVACLNAGAPHDSKVHHRLVGMTKVEYAAVLVDRCADELSEGAGIDSSSTLCDMRRKVLEETNEVLKRTALKLQDDCDVILRSGDISDYGDQFQEVFDNLNSALSSCLDVVGRKATSRNEISSSKAAVQLLRVLCVFVYSCLQKQTLVETALSLTRKSAGLAPQFSELVGGTTEFHMWWTGALRSHKEKFDVATWTALVGDNPSASTAVAGKGMDCHMWEDVLSGLAFARTIETVEAQLSSAAQAFELVFTAEHQRRHST